MGESTATRAQLLVDGAPMHMVDLILTARGEAAKHRAAAAEIEDRLNVLMESLETVST